jgi:copper chaperone CopZ
MLAALFEPAIILAQGGKPMTKRAAFFVAAFLFLASPMLAHLRNSDGTTAPATAQRRLTQCAFKVHGMVCSMCAEGVQQPLMKLEGVKSASADYKTVAVRVKYDPSKTKPPKKSSKVSIKALRGSTLSCRLRKTNSRSDRLCSESSALSFSRGEP